MTFDAPPAPAPPATDAQPEGLAGPPPLRIPSLTHKSRPPFVTQWGGVSKDDLMVLTLRCAFGPPGNASAVGRVPHIQARQPLSSARTFAGAPYLTRLEMPQPPLHLVASRHANSPLPHVPHKARPPRAARRHHQGRQDPLHAVRLRRQAALLHGARLHRACLVWGFGRARRVRRGGCAAPRRQHWGRP